MTQTTAPYPSLKLNCNNNPVHNSPPKYKYIIFKNIYLRLETLAKDKTKTTGQWRELTLASRRQNVLFLSESVRKETAIKSISVKNTHYSGILRWKDLYLETATSLTTSVSLTDERRTPICTLARRRIGRLSRFTEEITSTPSQRAHGQAGGPMSKQRAATNAAKSLWRDSGSRRGRE